MSREQLLVKQLVARSFGADSPAATIEAPGCQWPMQHQRLRKTMQGERGFFDS